MLNEEKIEKAKSWLSALDIKSEFEAISKEIILQYIEQLENKIKEMEESKEVREAMEVAGLKVTALVSLKHENERLRKGQASLMSSRIKWKDRYYKIRKMLSKQNKIINEMAGYIATLDIDEDICSKTQNEHCDKMSLGECESCIKKHFEKKVEEKE